MSQLTVVERLKGIGHGQNVGVSNRDSTEHVDLVPDHMFLAFHEFLANHLDGVLFPSLDLFVHSSDRGSNSERRLSDLIPGQANHGWVSRSINLHEPPLSLLVVFKHDGKQERVNWRSFLSESKR